MIKLSIIICSFNRSTELEQLLEDLSLQYDRLDDDARKEIELILVDNNSFDNTNEIVYRYIENTSLSIKFFTEQKLGLTHCRNLAISKASGTLLAFLHDDITLDEDWLQEACKLADNCEEQEIGVYGGRIVPLWQSEPPDWFSINNDRYSVSQELFDIHSYGDKAYYYPFDTGNDVINFPCGAHVFIRKEVFDNCGLFRTDIGPSAAGGLGAGDDFEFFQYLSTLKIPMFYVPECMVFQAIKPHQLTLKYIRRQHYKFAKAKYWIAHTDRLKKEATKEDPKLLYLQFTLLVLDWLFCLCVFNKRRRSWTSFQLSQIIGLLDARTLLKENTKRKKFTFAKPCSEAFRDKSIS